MPKEQYMCQLCANHGIFNQPKKGHKQKCPFRSCLCNSCSLNTKRRALDQIERKLRVKDSPTPPPVLEKQATITPTPISYTNPFFREPSETSIDNVSNIPPSQSTHPSSFVTSQSTNTSSFINFSIPLPATVPIFPSNNVKSNLDFFKQSREENISDNQNSEIVMPNHMPYIVSNKDELENINKERRSIFHSVEMLTREET
uniref:DM domain-containing protein n=1 Tax=Strongyloides papillosus TaxID=174720 RepID=A0A0N5CBI0_STREA